MFTLVAFNQAVSGTGDFKNIAGAADQTVHVVGDVIYVPERFTKMVCICAHGYDIVKAKLESPSIRRIGVMMIEPKTNCDYNYYWSKPVGRFTPRSPITLVAGEGIEGFVHVGSNEADFASIGVWLSDGLITPVEGEIWTVRATFASVTTLTTKWVNTEVTFDETLPVGRYQVVGGSIWHQDGALFRLVFVGEPNRPGGMTFGGTGSIEPWWQRLGHLGVWGEFHSSTPPSVDILGMKESASTGSIELDIIKIA